MIHVKATYRTSYFFFIYSRRYIISLSEMKMDRRNKLNSIRCFLFVQLFCDYLICFWFFSSFVFLSALHGNCSIVSGLSSLIHKQGLSVGWPLMGDNSFLCLYCSFHAEETGYLHLSVAAYLYHVLFYFVWSIISSASSIPWHICSYLLVKILE